MRITRPLVFLFAALACAPLGCGDDDDAAPIQALCEKTDECNYLPEEVTVDQCVEQTNACLKMADEDVREEWDKLARECLKKTDCGDFSACYRGMNPSDC